MNLSADLRRVQGQPCLPPHTWLGQWARLLIGLSIVTTTLRCIGFVMGYRSRMEMELSPASLDVRRIYSWLGLRLRERHEVFSLGKIEAAGRKTHRHSWPWWVSLVFFAAATVVGAVFVADGFRVMEWRLIALGAGIVGAGLLLDLVFETMAHRGLRKGYFYLELANGKTLWMNHVTMEEAEVFLKDLRGRLESNQTNVGST